MIFSPQTELFNYFYSYCDDSGMNTYDHLPTESENAPYPFVLIGNNQLVPDGTKYALNGTISQTIDIWNLADDRATTSKILEDIYHQALICTHTQSYNLAFNKKRSETQMVTDTNVQGVSLLHGILDLKFDIL